MKPSELTKGQRVFLEDGQAAEFIIRLDDQFLVRAELQDEEEEVYHGKPFLVRQVFSEPPVEVYEKQIAALIAEERAIQDRLRTAREEESVIQKSQASRLVKLKKNRALERIEQFLDGKITHFVTERYGEIVIIASNESYDSDDRWNKETRLFSLFGKSDGDLEYRLNYYSDGSGSSFEAFPLESEEEARAKAVELIDAKYQHWRSEKKNAHLLEHAVKSAQKLGLPIPDDIAAALRERQVASLRAIVESKLKEINTANAQISALGK